MAPALRAKLGKSNRAQRLLVKPMARSATSPRLIAATMPSANRHQIGKNQRRACTASSSGRSSSLIFAGNGTVIDDRITQVEPEHFPPPRSPDRLPKRRLIETVEFNHLLTHLGGRVARPPFSPRLPPPLSSAALPGARRDQQERRAAVMLAIAGTSSRMRRMM